MLFVLVRLLVEVTTCWEMVGFSPHLQRSSQTSAACPTAQFSSDAVCLEIGSGSPQVEGSIPQNRSCNTLMIPLQVQVLTCISDHLAESNMLMIQLRSLTFKMQASSFIN